MNSNLIITLVSKRSAVPDIKVRLIVSEMERLDILFKDQFMDEFKKRIAGVKLSKSKVQLTDIFRIVENDRLLEIWKYKMNQDPNYLMYRIGGLL